MYTSALFANLFMNESLSSWIVFSMTGRRFATPESRTRTCSRPGARLRGYVGRSGTWPYSVSGAENCDEPGTRMSIGSCGGVSRGGDEGVSSKLAGTNTDDQSRTSMCIELGAESEACDESGTRMSGEDDGISSDAGINM